MRIYNFSPIFVVQQKNREHHEKIHLQKIRSLVWIRRIPAYCHRIHPRRCPRLSSDVRSFRYHVGRPDPRHHPCPHRFRHELPRRAPSLLAVPSFLCVSRPVLMRQPSGLPRLCRGSSALLCLFRSAAPLPPCCVSSALPCLFRLAVSLPPCRVHHSFGKASSSIRPSSLSTTAPPCFSTSFRKS